MNGGGSERIPQSATIRVPLYAVLSSDHYTPATGKTIAVTISKNGGAFGNPSGGATNAVEISNGWYYVDLSTTDTGTLGPLIVLGTAATIDQTSQTYDVVNANTGGLGNLDVAVSSRLPTASITLTGGAVTVGTNNDKTGYALSATQAFNLTGNITGSLSGSVGSVTARVTANADQWAGTTIPAPNVAGVPLIDLKYTLGTPSPAAPGYIGIDWAAIANPTAPIVFSNTAITGNSTIATVGSVLNPVTVKQPIPQPGAARWSK